MRVMGIDPGLTRCGLGDADVDEARSTRGVHVDDAQAAARQARVDAHDTHQARFTISTNIA